MKKLSDKRRRWLHIHRRGIEQRRFRKLHRIRKCRARHFSYASIIRAPEVITLSLSAEKRRLFLNFLALLRDTRHKPGRHLIDFSSTTHIYAEGMILFRAELCSIINGAHAGVYRCKPPHETRIKEVLYQAGIFQVIGQNVRIEPKHPDVVHWRTAHGQKAEGVKSGNLLEEYEGQIAKDLMSDLFVGVTEAMTNVHHHAYIKPSEQCRVADYCRKDADKGGGWWMFSQKKDGYLHVVICDLGVGIPGSLPDRRPKIVDRLLSLGLGDKDSKYIEHAVEDSVSRTRKHHRGKGLGQIVNGLLEHSQDSNILIHSNRGYFRRDRDGEKTYDFKDSILGTVICWRTPLTT